MQGVPDRAGFNVFTFQALHELIGRHPAADGVEHDDGQPAIGAAKRSLRHEGETVNVGKGFSVAVEDAAAGVHAFMPCSIRWVMRRFDVLKVARETRKIRENFCCLTDEITA